MGVKLLTKHHLEFLSLKGSCTDLSASTLVKMPYFWKSHVTAHYATASLTGSEISLYSIMTPLKYNILENFMENGAFAFLEHLLHFP